MKSILLSVLVKAAATAIASEDPSTYNLNSLVATSLITTTKCQVPSLTDVVLVIDLVAPVFKLNTTLPATNDIQYPFLVLLLIINSVPIVVSVVLIQKAIEEDPVPNSKVAESGTIATPLLTPSNNAVLPNLPLRSVLADPFPVP